MKTTKKSHANTFPFLIAFCILILFAVIRQPTLRSYFGIGNQSMWNTLVAQVNSNSVTLAQDLWEFREFYSRGTIQLQKNQALEIPAKIAEIISFPSSFDPYLVFTSPKIVSIEGSMEQTDQIFFPQGVLDNLNWELVTQSNSVQIIKAKNKNIAVVIAVFNMQTAELTNGYLYFDMREEAFRNKNGNKNWLIVSLVTL